jgi:serralysin
LIFPAINNGIAKDDTLISIENLILSRGNDVAYGNNGANMIAGRDGHDRLFGLLGNDKLYGENGNDQLFGGLGADRLDGGEGFDYAAYDDDNYAGFIVSLTNPKLNTGVAAGDTFFSIEGLILSSGDDIAYGNAGDNYIYGRAGNDTLYGYLGTDHLYGEAGADRFMFNTPPSAANMDYIGDFETGIDSIGLAYSLYGLAHEGGGSVRFLEGAGVTGSDTRALLGVILFDTVAGLLSFDPDGGGNKPAVPIAILLGVHDIDKGDLFFM